MRELEVHAVLSKDVLKKILRDSPATINQSLDRSMGGVSLVFEIRDRVAKLVEILTQIFVVVVEIEKLDASLRYQLFQSGKKYLFLLYKMHVQMLPDRL